MLAFHRALALAHKRFFPRASVSLSPSSDRSSRFTLFLAFSSKSFFFFSLFDIFLRLFLQTMQPMMKTQIETARTMASERMIMESVRLVWDVVDQPAGRMESTCAETVGTETGVDNASSSTVRSEEGAQH
jgi:hypothetical protein